MYITRNNLKLFRLYRIFKKIYEIAKGCKRYYSPITLIYHRFFILTLRLYIKKGFRPNEIFNLGLIHSKLDKNELSKYTSQNTMNIIQGRLNNSLWRCIVNNKGIFYKYSHALNLPIPKLYAILNKDGSSISDSGTRINNCSDWIKFVRGEIPNEFVIKPSMGKWGEFIYVYSKTNSKIMDESGKPQNENDIYEMVMQNQHYDSFIVQERLNIHPNFFEISPSKNLHCARIITLVNSIGKVQILHGQLNLVTGKNTASQEGNLKIDISLNDGRLDHGVLLNRNKGGFERITKHPETGKSFKGFRIPNWEDILLLAEKAATTFLPLRTLGWDFAVTENGVKILEANAFYGPPNYFQPMDKFVKTLLDG